MSKCTISKATCAQDHGDITTSNDTCTNKYTNKYKKTLFEMINSLSSTEHEEVFKIIKEHGVNFSRNKNGIFFSISNISDEIVGKIDEFVHFCVSNKKDLDEYDKKLNECKLHNNYQQIMPQTINIEMMAVERPRASWSNYKASDENVEKFQRFVDKIVQDRDKILKKKGNVKYNTAKKKYSKKMSDRKIEGELVDNLYRETNLLC